MSLKKYNKTNFHKHTFCEFIEVDVATIPTIDWHYKSKSGSGYCFTEEGVYRISNHWGRAANCRWRLISNSKTSSNSKINNGENRIGFAKWIDFYPNNETENFFYVEVNFDDKEVTFQHKNNPKYDGKAVYRDPQGNIAAEGNYTSDKKTGVWKFYINGTLDYTENMSFQHKNKKASKDKTK